MPSGINGPRREPPGPVEPPEEEVYQIEVYWCQDCRELIGPALSGMVGEKLSFEHEGHASHKVDEWEEEVEVDQ